MVRCTDCGLLALRSAATGALCEAERSQRTYSDIRIGPGRSEIFRRIPVCFALVVDFSKELKEKPDECVHPTKITPLLEQERECPKFFGYMPGRSPQEHQTMVEQIEVQRMQDAQREKERKWQEEQKAADRKWQDDQRANDEARQEARISADRSWQKEQKNEDRKWQLKLAILAAILSVVTGLVTAGVSFVLCRLMK
jgi:hypothetical protein